MAFVYVATAENWPGVCKVGITKNLQQRARSIRYAYSNDIGKITMRYWMDDCDLGHEHHAHKLLALFREQDEWFRVTPQQAWWAVLFAKRDTGKSQKRRPHPGQSLPFHQVLGCWFPREREAYVHSHLFWLAHGEDPETDRLPEDICAWVLSEAENVLAAAREAHPDLDGTALHKAAHHDYEMSKRKRRAKPG